MIEIVPSNIKEEMIFICEKCGIKIQESTGASENPSKTLLTNLREYLFNKNKKGIQKVLLTSCLSICPKNKITASIINIKESHITFKVIEQNDLKNEPGSILEDLCTKDNL